MRCVVAIIATYAYLLIVETCLAWMQSRVLEEKTRLFGTVEDREVVHVRLATVEGVQGGWYRWHPEHITQDFAIGTFPKTRILGYNEGRGYPVHLSDRYGFFNEDDWWDEKCDVVVLGDSFASCQYVFPSESIASSLRRRGVKAISLGVTGTGGLFQVATLKTYLPRIYGSPVVVWIYYQGNDMRDTREEFSVSMLRDCLSDGWTHSPNQDNLNKFVVQTHFNAWYMFSSAITLSRTRTWYNSVTASGSETRMYQQCVDSVLRLTNEVVLVHIPWQRRKEDKQWDSIVAPHKIRLQNDRSNFGMGHPDAHLSVKGIEDLTVLLVDYIRKLP